METPGWEWQETLGRETQRELVAQVQSSRIRRIKSFVVLGCDDFPNDIFANQQLIAEFNY